MSCRPRAAPQCSVRRGKQKGVGATGGDICAQRTSARWDRSFPISLPAPGHDFQANRLPSSHVTPHCTSRRGSRLRPPPPAHPDTRGLKPSSGAAESRATGPQPESRARSRGLKQRAALHLRACQIRRLSAWTAFSRCHTRAVRSGQDGSSAAAPPAGSGRHRAG